MTEDRMVIPSRAWSVEATMGHCILWPTGAQPALPADRYDGRAYAREMVDLLQRGVARGINGIDILHGERGGYADPGGIFLEDEALRLGVPFSLGGHVGHGFPHWMPRSLLEQRPELGRMDSQGRRVPDGNLCTADPEALGRALGELSLLLDRHPRARLLQIFPDDVLGGSWCSCPRCRDRSATEQYATLVAATAGVLDARRPGTELGFLLYHDTLSDLPDPPASRGASSLPPNVYALFAPRERCYAHAIDDDACPRNRFYWRNLVRASEVFGGRVDVFEYYGDTILWHYFNVAIPRTIAADLRAYHRLGVREVQALQFGTYSRWAHGLNLAAFAWLASGQETDVQAAVARYAEEQYGRAAGEMGRYYQTLEKTQAEYLRFCEYPDEWMGDLRGTPGPSPEYGPHRQRVAACRDEFGRLAEILGRAVQRAGGGEAGANVQAEQVSLEIARVELEQLERRLSIGERWTEGGSGEWSAAEQEHRISARQRQWDLAQRVPVELRGQAFGALAP